MGCPPDQCVWGLGAACLGRRIEAVCGDPRYEPTARLQAGPLNVDRPGKGPIVSWLSPSCYVGGAERQSFQLMKASRGRIRWGWYGVWCHTRVAEPMRTLIEKYSPVLIGGPAIEAMHRHSDIILRWGYNGKDIRPEPGRKFKTVYISHGCGPWTTKVFTHPEDVDHVVAVSRAALDPLPDWARDKATLIPNGIDLDALEPKPGAREELREILGVRRDQKLVLWLGRFSREKAPFLWVDGMCELHRAHPGRFAFAALGDGQMLETATGRARSLRTPIRFLGAREEVGDWLAAADYLVMTSKEEADSLAALESMACGVPLISTRVGRLREVEYKRLARLLPTNPTPGDVAAAVLEDETDRGRDQRVELARQIVRRDHSAEAMAQRWVTYLSTL